MAEEDDKADGLSDLEVSLVDAVGGDLAQILAEYAEAGLDSAIRSEAWQAVPVLGTLVAVGRGVGAIRDRIFARRLLQFLENATPTPAARAKFALENADPKARRRIGEVLLSLLDRADDSVKVKMLGSLHAMRVMEEIDEKTMMEASRRLLGVETEDLRRLKRAGAVLQVDEDVRWRLSNAGIIQGLRDEGAEYSILTWRGSSVTKLGDLLLSVLPDEVAASPNAASGSGGVRK